MVADVIGRHVLDTKHGFTLNTITLANTEAGRISLTPGASDIVASDRPFVAVQRAAGTKLCFAPFSSSSSGVMTAAQSSIHTLADQESRKLGVAGGLQVALNDHANGARVVSTLQPKHLI